MILFKDVSYKVLQLTVISGATDLSGLNVFKSDKKYIPNLDLTVHAGIIGTSHFVQLQYNDQIFTELFACETIENSISKPLCYLPIDALKDEIALHSDCFNYQFYCQKLPYHSNVNDITNWIVKQQQNESFIFLTFDFKTPEQYFPTSRTILAIQPKKNGIDIKTIHEYQEENAIIVSDSKIHLDTLDALDA